MPVHLDSNACLSNEPNALSLLGLPDHATIAVVEVTSAIDPEIERAPENL